LELLSIGEQHAAVYTVGNRGDLLRDFGELAGAAELYHRTLQYACQVGDADLIAESYCRLADIQLGKQHYGEAARLLRKASSSAHKAHSREFAICARLLKAEINLKSKGSAVAGAIFEEAGREAADAGLHYYLLWARHGQNRCLLHEDRAKEALRFSRRGQIQAHRAGYRWWELRFAGLGAQIEVRHGIMNGPSPARGETMLEKAIALKSAIEATIGDPAVRARFGQLPLILSIAALDHEHAALTSR
jgi:tetratricopeptide (TPR) repeat protein